MQQLVRALGQSSIYAVFQGLVLLCSLISFPILTRILSVGEYGALSLVNTTATLVVALAKCGLATAFLRYHARLTAEMASERAALSATAFWTALALAGAAACIYGSIVLAFGLQGETLTRSLLLIVMAMVVVYAARDLYYAFLRAEEKVLRVSYTTLGIRFGGIVGGLSLAILWQQKVLGFFVGTVAVEGAAIAMLWLAYARRGLLRTRAVSPHLAGNLLVYGAPLIVFEFSSLANDYVHRYLLAQFLGLESVGIYSVGYNLATYVQALVVSPVWLALFPIYSRMWESEGREATQRFLGSVLRLYSAVAIGIFLLVFLNGEQLVRILASEKFAPGATVFIWICGMLLLHGSSHLLGAGFHLLKRTGRLAAITAAAAGLNVVLNIVLIPRLGIMGAVYASVGSYCALTFGIFWVSRALLRVAVPWDGVLRHAGAAMLAGLAAQWIEMSAPLGELALRSLVAVGMYVGCLYCLDRAMRDGLKLVLRNRRGLLGGRA